MAGMRILYLTDFRYDTYRTVVVELSQARSGKKRAARVRLRTSAAHRSGLVITFRQLLPQRPCLRSWDYGCSGSLRRRGTLALAATTEGERPSLRRALDLGGRTRAFLSREERAAMQCAPICYRLSLRMIPSNTTRRV